ncbi:hypothetical protein VNO77_21345 [Canavalia gladiata]|uniref:Uncharacterized protein n=1 Tax=Canavalia gladiata TaxID=3824 RepID=A0AAN9LRA5_CANGL
MPTRLFVLEVRESEVRFSPFTILKPVVARKLRVRLVIEIAATPIFYSFIYHNHIFIYFCLDLSVFKAPKSWLFFLLRFLHFYHTTQHNCVCVQKSQSTPYGAFGAFGAFGASAVLPDLEQDSIKLFVYFFFTHSSLGCSCYPGSKGGFVQLNQHMKISLATLVHFWF